MAPAPLAVLAPSCDLEKFYTLPDRALLRNGFHTTFLRQQVTRTVYSPFDQWAATGSFYDCHDPHDLLC
jgi:hypothetical protein